MKSRTKSSHPINRTILIRGGRHDLLPPETHVVFPHTRSCVHVAFLLPAPDPPVDRRHTRSGFPGDTARRLSPDPQPNHPGALGRVRRPAGLSSFHRRPRWKGDRRQLRQNSCIPPMQCSSGRLTGILLFVSPFFCVFPVTFLNTTYTLVYITSLKYQLSCRIYPFD